ncbi:MFS transporter [Streptomyces sp. NPDC088768]|uniref:MFS transporter n=1 Tax=Streptomyces sp. NPDC088768 TaxID=3365894 RepID=UPI0037F9851A
MHTTVTARPRGLRGYYLGLASATSGGEALGVTLPLVAVLSLHGSVMDVAVLKTATEAPPLVTALWSGAVSDRWPRQHVLVGAQLFAAALSLVLAFTQASGLLTMPVLLAVTLLLGAVSDVSTTASIAYLPDLSVPAERVAATSRAQVVTSVSKAVGTYLSALLLAGGTTVWGPVLRGLGAVGAAAGYGRTSPLRSRFVSVPAVPGRRWEAMFEGVRYVLRTPVTREIVAANILVSAGTAALDVVAVVYWVSALHWSGGAVATLTGCGLLGGVLGAAVAGRLVRARGRWWGLGPSAVVAIVVIPLCQIPTVFAGPGEGWQMVLGALLAVRYAAAAVLATSARSMRQGLCPDHLRGREYAAGSWLARLPVIAVIVTVAELSQRWGPRPAMALALTVALGAGWTLLRSPTPHVIHQPAPGPHPRADATSPPAHPAPQSQTRSEQGVRDGTRQPAPFRRRRARPRPARGPADHGGPGRGGDRRNTAPTDR